MSNIITTVFTDQLVNALCNTLVYSLLQGVLLAAAAGLIVVFTRKVSAATRYNLLVGVLVLFALGTVTTFIVQFNHIVPVVATQVVHQTVGNTDVVRIVENGGNQSAGESFMGLVTYYLNTYHNVIVLIWFLIICAKSIQLATGLQGVYLLKRKNVYKVAVEWETKMRFMAYKLGIKQKIALLESGLAKVPMVIGHLKPVILIPVGLLTALSTTEVEAILMHELAHIRRRDYLVNLLQSMVEIVFFFNPAVLWVSQLIKTEREHCCDDMALANNTSKAGYISALVSCEEYQASPAYAMAFPGQKKYLVDRVKRLVTNRNHSLDVFEKTLLTICLVMSGLCFSAYAEKDNIKKAMHAVVSVIKQPKLNLAERKKLDEQTAALDNQTAKLDSQTAEADSKTSQLDGAGPGVPAGGDTIKKSAQKNQQAKVDKRIDSAVNDQVSTNVNTRISTNLNTQLSINSLGKLNGKLGPSTNVNLQNFNVSIDSINTRVRVNTNLSRLQTNYHIDSINKQVGLKANQAKLQRLAYLDSAKQYRKQAKMYAAQPIPAHEPYMVKKIDLNKPSKEEKAQYEAINKKLKDGQAEDNARRDAAINEMLKDGLIKNRDNLSFKISNKELIINYQKQPEAVFQKYKAKYVKNTNGDWSWMYNYDSDKKTETNTVVGKSNN